MQQCLGEKAPKSYLDFAKGSCSNISSPCWIPQVDNILDKNTTIRLPKCDTLEKYLCMLKAARAMYRVNKFCDKTCKVTNYEILFRDDDIYPFRKVTISHKFMENYTGIHVQKHCRIMLLG